MFQFFGGEGASILTTLIISFAKKALHHIPSYKISQAYFLEKSLVVIAVCPRQSAFRESETHFSSFSPTSSSSSLPAPRYQLSTLISTHYTSLISMLLQNVRSHRRKNGEEIAFDFQFFKETKSSSQQLESRNQAGSQDIFSIVQLWGFEAHIYFYHDSWKEHD